MRVGYTSDREKEKKKKDNKKQQSILEKEIMSIMEKGLILKEFEFAKNRLKIAVTL